MYTLQYIINIIVCVNRNRDKNKTKQKGKDREEKVAANDAIHKFGLMASYNYDGRLAHRRASPLLINH